MLAGTNYLSKKAKISLRQKGFMYHIVAKQQNDNYLSKTFAGSCMRSIIRVQLQVGETDIVKVRIELTTRNEIPQLLRGLQQIHKNRVILTLLLKSYGR